MSALTARVAKLVDEVGLCWEWRGARHCVSGYPMMRHQGLVRSVRWFLAVDIGIDVQDKFVTNTCNNQRCVNPEHIEAVELSTLRKRIADRTLANSNPARRQKISAAKRKITPEVVAEIRAAEGTRREIAARFGISVSTVNSIMRYETALDFKNPFFGLMKR